jgi:hypothetical protein
MTLRPLTCDECGAPHAVPTSHEGETRCAECGMPHVVGHDMAEGRVYPWIESIARRELMESVRDDARESA